MKQYKKEVETLKAQMETKQEKLEDQRDRIIRQANEEAHAVLREAKEYADQTMKMFHKFQKRPCGSGCCGKKSVRICANV